LFERQRVPFIPIISSLLVKLRCFEVKRHFFGYFLAAVGKKVTRSRATKIRGKEKTHKLRKNNLKKSKEPLTPALSRKERE
jgi:predicted ABC-type sugar transport system permease subunit